MKMHGKRLLCLVMTVAVLFSACAIAVSARIADSASRIEKFGLNNADTVCAIVVLQDDAVADLGVDPQSTAALKREQKLLSAQEKFLNRVGLDAEFHYTELFNGVAVNATVAQLKAIEQMSGVKAVYLANTYDMPSDEVIAATSAAAATGATLLNNLLNVTGDGVVVAVVDTGINYTHEILQPNKLMINPALSEEDIANTSTVYKGQYISEKIPFSYDYYDKDNDCLDEAGHGSHVSGIIGGYLENEDGEVVFSGSAPAVQLLGMKVFGASGGTNSSYYLAALEDAYRLGADVLNMSLGSPSGFTHDEELEAMTYGDVFEKLDKAGCAVFCSAGNDTNLSYAAMNYASAWYGQQWVNSGIIDFGVPGSPSTYPWNVSVASADNVSYPSSGLSLDGENFFAFSDTQAGTSLDFKANFENKTFDFVYIDALGEAADFAKVDVAGKVVAVNRGSISFLDKVKNAKAAGAIGVIVVNNEDAMINMQLDEAVLPAAAVSLSAKTALLACSGKEVTMTVGSTVIEVATAGEMSYFSSWGTTTDLSFKPQITGIGGYLYSSTLGASDAYEVMSGTSMSSPNVAGSYASLVEWLRRLYPEMEKYEMSVLAENLLFSTATVLDNGKANYSPRQQGAGLANVMAAVKTPAYITNANQSLGYDAAGTGAFSVTYHVVNLQNKTIFLYAEPELTLDKPAYDSEEGLAFNTLTTISMSSGAGDYDYTLTVEIDGEAEESDVIVLAPGQEADVTLDVQVDPELVELWFEYFENGFFIDGYLMFYDYYDVYNYINFGTEFPEVLFHGAFYSFCGDWLAAPALEHITTEDIKDAYALLYRYGIAKEQVTIDLLLTALQMLGYDTINIGWNDVYLVNGIRLLWLNSLYGIEVGSNPYGNAPSRYTNSDRNAITTSLSPSYNLLGSLDMVYFETAVIRNCKELIMVVTDVDTGEVILEDSATQVAKDALDSSTASYYQHRMGFIWDGSDADGNYVPSGTHALISIYSVLDHPDATERKFEWSMPVTVDYTNPIVAYSYDDETKQLTLTATDNEFLSAMFLYDAANDVDYIGYAYYSDVAGDLFTYYVDLSDCEGDVLTLEVADWASNVSTYEIPLTYGSISFSEIPVDVQIENENCAVHVLSETSNLYEMYDFVVIADEGYCTGIAPTVTVNGEEVEPTLSENGAYYYSVPVIAANLNTATYDELYMSVNITAPEHEFTDWEYIKAPNCMGGSESRVCIHCGLYEEQEVAPVHTPGEPEVVIEATCTHEGLRYTKCAICGVVLEIEKIDKLEHTAAEAYVTVLEPTCTEEGKEVLFCTECGEVLDEKTIAAKGHTAGEWEETEHATCTGEGERVKCCVDCGEVLEVEATAAAGHKAGDWVTLKEATCTEKGIQVKYCEVCDAIVESQETEALGHTEGDVKVVINATCTTEGVQYTICKTCGEILHVDSIAAKGHTEGDWEETAHATCTGEGERVKHCTECGELLAIEATDAKGHTAGDWTTLKEATCTEKGIQVKYCADCDAIVDSQETAAHGHTEGNVKVVTAATCSAEGVQYTTCKTCGEVLHIDPIAKLAHTVGEWEVTKEATLTEEGLRVKRCTVCGAVVESEVIPKVPYILGDVDGNGKVNTKDYFLVKAYCLDTGDLTADQFIRADVNGDGKVDTKDYFLIKQIVLGN